jgi:hypothetical protein
MRADHETLFNELIKAADLGDSEMITGAVLILRCKDMDKGRTSVAMGHTEDTDGVVMLGLLHAAIEIQRQGEWQQPNDD